MLNILFPKYSILQIFNNIFKIYTIQSSKFLLNFDTSVKGIRESLMLKVVY